MPRLLIGVPRLLIAPCSRRSWHLRPVTSEKLSSNRLQECSTTPWLAAAYLVKATLHSNKQYGLLISDDLVSIMSCDGMFRCSALMCSQTYWLNSCTWLKGFISLPVGYIRRGSCLRDAQHFMSYWVCISEI